MSLEFNKTAKTTRFLLPNGHYVKYHGELLILKSGEFVNLIGKEYIVSHIEREYLLQGQIIYTYHLVQE